MCSSMSSVLAAVLAWAPYACAFGAGVAPDDQSFAVEAGETQSTVVPPGLKTQCPSGRFIVTNDWVRPSTTPGLQTTGVARWRDLNGGAEGASVVDAPPNAADYSFLTNDHNIVVLSNGDVIYQTGAGSKRPIGGPSLGLGRAGPFGLAKNLSIAKPDWFDVTFRGDFGPGARTALLAWKSTDCGETFQFLSELDSFGLGWEDCASPQAMAADYTPVRPEQKFDMGGTDGPWLGIDHATGELMATQGCVGSALKKFSTVAGTDVFGKKKVVEGLGLGEPIGKTYLYTSADSGATWRARGAYQNYWGWRMPAVSRGQAGYAAAFGASLLLGGLNAKGEIPGWSVKPAPAGSTSWDGKWFWENPKWYPLGADGKRHVNRVCTNGVGWGVAVESRVPGSNAILLAFPASLKPPAKTPASAGVSPKAAIVGAIKDKLKIPEALGGPSGGAAAAPPALTHGFRLVLYRPDTDEMSELPPALPVGGTVDQAVMQLNFIDPGDGPILAYWYDVDAASETAIIRGRMILGPDRMSKDFDISRAGGKARAFSLIRTDGGTSICKVPGSYWFGDYKTAGGFKAGTPRASGLKGGLAALRANGVLYRYFPMWVEPDKTIRYTEISHLESPQAAASAPAADIEELPPIALEWRKPGPPPEPVTPDSRPLVGGLQEND